MQQTPKLQLPYISPSQAQKHVTHNEAIRTLDAVVQLAVIDRDLAAPPMSPEMGDSYISSAMPTADWLGLAGKIAVYQDGSWHILEPQIGWLALVIDEATLVYWTGVDWTTLSGPNLQSIALLGINTTADAANPLSARLNNALFTARTVADGGTGSLRLKVNKESAGATASHLYQNAYSGRAEAGLIGTDSFSIKVSADGSSWNEAMVADSQTGKVRFPKTNLLADYAVNLYQDSGRFAGNGAAGVTVGAFSFPAYLATYNGTTASGHAKFITNNNDYGGSAGALNSDIKALVDGIRDPAYRQYGLEFWAAKITQGSGTSSPVISHAQTFYMSVLTAQIARAPKMTFHAYLRALDDNILIRWNAGQTIIANGVPSTSHVVVTPAPGWISVTIVDEADPRMSFGYNPAIFGVYSKSSGHRWLVACPALLGGSTQINDSTGIIAAANCWPA